VDINSKSNLAQGQLQVQDYPSGVAANGQSGALFAQCALSPTATMQQTCPTGPTWANTRHRMKEAPAVAANLKPKYHPAIAMSIAERAA
jgi:hypothetical protein